MLIYNALSAFVMKENKMILWIVFAFVLVIAILGFPRMMGYNYSYGSYGMMSGFGLAGGFGFICMILVIFALVLFIIWISKQIQDNGRRSK